MITEAQDLLKKINIADIEVKLEASSKIQNEGNYNDPKFVEAVREYNIQNELLNLFKELDRKVQEYNSTTELLNDENFKDIATEDLAKLETEIPILVNKLKSLTKKPLTDDDKKAIFEIRPGVGGVEASLFAEDLFRMYVRFCNLKGFRVEQYSLEYNTEGGINEAVFLVDEPASFGLFRFESGVHRVQRVPSTESLGRIHTSTASVVVMPQFEKANINIAANDLRIDVYRSSGPGGQSVNTTDSAVRITHLPTKITVTSQNSKSQHANKETAMKILISKLQQIENEKKSSSEKDLRDESIKGGDRSSKIRTYNFPQGRITDHRIQESWFNIPAVMEGEIEEIVNIVNTQLREE